MSRRQGSIGRDYFNDLYATDPDPWRFASSDYEQGKYAATLAMLPERRFVAGLEVGCSIGILTRQLAARCDALLALDVADAALAQARKNCPSGHVTFENRHLPGQWPVEAAQGGFDLVVLSEMLYYLDQQDIERLAIDVRHALMPDGLVLLVHYLGETDYPVTGDMAAELFLASVSLPIVHRARNEAYRIDLVSRG